MNAYQDISGNIGTLLRLIKEDQSKNPAAISAASDPSSPVRQSVATPLTPVESPNSSLVVGLRPEGVVSPGTPATSTVTPGVTASRVGPVSLGGGEEFSGAPVSQLPSETLPTSASRAASPGQVTPASRSTIPTETLRVVSPVIRPEPTATPSSNAQESPRSEAQPAPTTQTAVVRKPASIATAIRPTPTISQSEKDSYAQTISENDALRQPLESYMNKYPEVLGASTSQPAAPSTPSQTKKVAPAKQSLATQIFKFIFGGR